MSDTLRVPLVMRDMDGLPYQEIADILGLGISAVKMRIKRARDEFRERYAALAPASV
jgi:RNA polymerase sigma-70 factor (ECF subfamily)